MTKTMAKTEGMDQEIRLDGDGKYSVLYSKKDWSYRVYRGEEDVTDEVNNNVLMLTLFRVFQLTEDDSKLIKAMAGMAEELKS